MLDDLVDDLISFQQEFDGLFNGFLQSDLVKRLPSCCQDKSLTTRTPRAEFEENEKEISVSYELPGVDKKDIQLNIAGNRIEVKVEKRQESKDDKGYMRIDSGFYRMTTLPLDVATDKIRANYKDGILRVVMPKVEKPKQNPVQIE